MKVAGAALKGEHVALDASHCEPDREDSDSGDDRSEVVFEDVDNFDGQESELDDKKDEQEVGIGGDEAKDRDFEIRDANGEEGGRRDERLGKSIEHSDRSSCELGNCTDESDGKDSVRIHRVQRRKLDETRSISDSPRWTVDEYMRATNKKRQVMASEELLCQRDARADYR